MNQQTEITKYIAGQFNLPTDDKSIRKILPTWWFNTRKKERGGLRLTDEGFARLTAHIKAHKVVLDEPVEYTNQLIIWLDNFVTCPWYITSKEIFVFNETVAIQLVLFSGNIARFTAAKAKKPKEPN
jgi:hypothetical protein